MLCRLPASHTPSGDDPCLNRILSPCRTSTPSYASRSASWFGRLSVMSVMTVGLVALAVLLVSLTCQVEARMLNEMAAGSAAPIGLLGVHSPPSAPVHAHLSTRMSRQFRSAAAAKEDRARAALASKTNGYTVLDDDTSSVPDESDATECGGNSAKFNQPLQIGGIFILLLSSLLGALLPVLAKSFKVFHIPPFLLCIGTTAGVGILLACGLIHMLQPAQEELTSPCLSVTWTDDYPAFSFLFAMIAILGMQLLDYAVDLCIQDRVRELAGQLSGKTGATKFTKDGTNAEKVADNVEVAVLTAIANADGVVPPANGVKDAVQSGPLRLHVQKDLDDPNISAARLGVEHSHLHIHRNAADNSLLIHAHPHIHDVKMTENGFNGTVTKTAAVADANATASTEKLKENSLATTGMVSHCASPSKDSHFDHEFAYSHGGHSHSHSHSILLIGGLRRSLSAYLLEFGVAVHSVLIGLTTGVVDESELKTLCIALAFHQFFEGIALGSRIADAETQSRCEQFSLIAIFALSAPLGMAIGVSISTSLNPAGVSYNLAAGILDGICGGILIYLGVTMLTNDFLEGLKKHGTTGWRRVTLFAALWIGAGIMAYIGRYA